MSILCHFHVFFCISLVFGVVFTLVATLLYSLEYVLADSLLHQHNPKHGAQVTGNQLVGYIGVLICYVFHEKLAYEYCHYYCYSGVAGSVMLLLYIVTFTIPRWHSLVAMEIAKHRMCVSHFSCVRANIDINIGIDNELEF